MEWQQIKEKGIVSYGNLYRISKVMKKAMEGKPVTVGMLGGSITQGSLSSTPSSCYAYLVYEWWADKFKDSRITYVNGGIGGTTSQFGLARVESDLLRYDPDFIITEFSVNDKATGLFKENYEGLIRKMLLHPSEPALMILNSVQYDNGMNAQDIHNEIGSHYELPIVSMKNSLYPEVEEGRIRINEITPDALHPNDRGHRMVADIMIHMLEKIYAEVLTGDVFGDYKVPESLITKNRYFDSVRYNNKNCQPELSGFSSDAATQGGITDVFKNGWKGRRTGDSIHFEVSGGMISVQYCKTTKRTAPVAKAVIDGLEDRAIFLDANFDETWGDCLYLEDILIEGASGVHTLDITIVKADTVSELDFYLVSVITANQNGSI